MNPVVFPSAVNYITCHFSWKERIILYFSALVIKRRLFISVRQLLNYHQVLLIFDPACEKTEVVQPTQSEVQTTWLSFLLEKPFICLRDPFW